MNGRSPLYNVNQIIVQRGLEQTYARFSKWLDKYLRRRYRKYYTGLQLYQNRSDSTLFYVIASYRDVPGIEIAAARIGDRIGEIYDAVWGDQVQRISVFRFLDYKRIIPPQSC
jgi:hypothetical protein